MSKAQMTKASYEGKALDVTKMDKLLKDSSMGYVKAKIWVTASCLGMGCGE